MAGLESYANRVVAAFLILVGTVMALSVKDDTLTTDEGLYLPTGYRYLTEANMRLGYEHPPLMRDLVTLPWVLYLDMKPTSEFIDLNSRELNDEVWAFGDRYIYSQREPAGIVLFAARLPMIVFCLGFLYFVYAVIRDRYGWREGAATAVLLALSPFFLTHGRLATLDVPTAFASFLAIFWFGRFLEKGDRKTMVAAGVALGVAQLIKFSLLTVVPFLGVLGVFYVLAFKREQAFSYAWKFVGLGLVALAVIEIFYAPHLANYPIEQQVADISYVLSTTRSYVYPRLEWIAWLAQYPVTRPWAEYCFGAAWQLTRHGAFGYFMGEGSNSSWPGFYPVGYFLKQPLAFHVLTLLAAVHLLRVGGVRVARRLLATVREHWFMTMGVCWIAFYLFALIGLNSGNTGSRYLLPILPFVGALVGVGCVRWILCGGNQRLKAATFGLLVLLQVVSVARVYPSFLGYFNEAVSPEDSSFYLVDTDADWGQDVKRLAAWMDEQGLAKIHLATQLTFHDAASGRTGDSGVYSNSYTYYLKDRFEVIPAGAPASGWIAVPSRLLRWGQTRPAGTEGWFSDSYQWLNGHHPVKIIGNSIFVYNIP